MKNPLSNTTKVYQSFAGHGVDVASLRVDDLDRLMLEEVTQRTQPAVLDLGCGAGGQSLRLAQLGAKVTAIDVFDFSEQFSNLRLVNNLSNDKLNFIKGDIKNLSELVKRQTFDLVYSQRTFHYLKYDDAFSILNFLRRITKEKLFISVTGIETTLADNYDAKTLPIRDRFAKLPKEAQETFQIYEPVCLYAKDEFMSLLKECGWQIEWCRQSDFGNVKAVCNL